MSLVKTLKQSNEVLGLNRRNAIYMRPYNTLRAKRIADDKLLCKKILSRHNIPTAEIYKVIRNVKQLNTLKWEELPKSFALKPNIGTGGSGIIVFYGKKTNALEWIKPDGSTMTVNQIQSHISNILDGQFSMGNRKDIALIEERIINDPLLKQYSYKGIPDIRVIVFNKVPIMAEMRLPTKQSDGKANLHAGGIGVGIDIGSGITTTSVIRKGTSPVSDVYEVVETTLDDKKLPLSGIQIPKWKEILNIAVKCQEASGLGFFGADIALDKNKGPVVFELNARPGIAIQDANVSGLRTRLDRIKGLKIKDLDHGIRVAQNIFGGEVEDEIKQISGRQIVGLVEKATLFAKIDPESKQESKKHKPSKIPDIKTKIRINSGTRRSVISSKTLSKLGYKEALDFFERIKTPENFDSREEAKQYIEQNEDKFKAHPLISEYIVTTEEEQVVIRPIIPIFIEIAGQKITSNIVPSKMSEVPYPAIIGRQDLRTFLIDPGKTFLLH